MSYYDDDRWEFDPEGEGRIEPDPTNSTAIDTGGYERGDDTLVDDHMGYPDTPGPGPHDEKSTEHRCACGAPLDPGRTKCDFCLTKEVEYEKAADTDTDREATGVIHVLIDASSEANAVCIAKTVFEDIAEDSSTPLIDDIDECELVAGLDDDLVDRFARKWGQLPAAAPIDSIPGQRQLDTIRQNAGHDYLRAKDGHTENNRPTLDPVLFDADGEPITDIEEVGQLIAGGTLDRTRLEWDTIDASDGPAPTWIVPAIALEQVSRSEPSNPSREGRTRRTLACLDCGEATRHRFAGWNEVPHPEFNDTPIWECTRCQIPQHGPNPDSEPADSQSR
ncbi:hypothetical protein C492_07650 [Natronococcus jeotgali DSM 18795]|uniref:Uncharacterized protein n=2 Tax=Natronococcus jeotgali TaxID=413812 RepID=L9XM28_9EURY|nr:hypothetical protein C492_07650 [Natronococcus jeotgali DSM 18795]